MQPDRARWNERYSSAPEKPASRSNPRLIQAVTGMAPGLACDVAMGVGHNVRFLCESGWKVVGIEISDLALIHAQRMMEACSDNAFFLQADAATVGLKPKSFDLVVCTYFLDRKIMPWITTLLKPKGKVFFETYDTNHLKYVPDFPKEYCLRDGEPQRMFKGYKSVRIQTIDNGSSSVASVVATLS
jgi:2-polyprenyl-3-methyl-5-hydroxy-6-metoxy-1,4-benzoquinol methylase